MTEEKPDDLLAKGKAAFQRAAEAESENRTRSLDDVRFARLGEQWPEKMRKQREDEDRPCLTINKMTAFIRQVVNDARQNKPQIKVHPVDSGADPETAEVINGLIRNIEYTSNADVAFDTGIEQSVSGGWGYWRVGMDYAYDDSFDMDLSIDRIANQYSVYGDPDAMSADSSEWNSAFIVDPMPKAEFERKYGKRKNASGEAVNSDFGTEAWKDAGDWITDGSVMVAEWWRREEVEREIVQVQDAQGKSTILSKQELEQDADLQVLIEAKVIKILGSRVTKSHKVTQVIMSGADILAVNEWPGKYIPIVPVYGDEVIIEGKRYLFSLFHHAKDAQRMFNYWRTTSTELVALAPRVPWIGRVGTFDSDIERWNTANTKSHAFLEFDGEAPQRQPLDVGPAAGALQEALSASDDMKAIIGMYDASLGARSNETSGRAIMARQREGDVSTFHFIDNLSRAIRHTGRILIDLIPKVYPKERIVRIIGEDGSHKSVKVNGPIEQSDENGEPQTDENGEVITAIHDLTAGKYDLTVSSGPSFTSRREEAAMQMTEFIRSFPQAAPIIGDLLARNLDWPGADEIADRLKALVERQNGGGIPPQMQQQMQQMQDALQKLQTAYETLKQDKTIDAYNAETNRLKVAGPVALTQNPFNGPFPIPGGPQPTNGDMAGAQPPQAPPMNPMGQG